MAMGLSSIVLGLMLLIGFLTPIAGLAATAVNLMNGTALLLATDTDKHASAFAAIDLAAISFAIVLLGPGAHSLDARLFGRREIIIPDAGRRPD